MRQLGDLFPGTNAVLLDGAMGTSLRAAGWPDGKDTLSANLDAPGMVEAVHQGFLDAGSRVILTNTFAAPFVTRLNAAEWRRAISSGVEIARRAAGKPVKVGGCLGVSMPDAGKWLTEAIRVVVECGVDLLVLETATRAEDARFVLEAALRQELPVVLCASSAGGGGEDEVDRLREMEAVALAAGKRVAFGLNCCRGPADVLRISRELGQWPVWVKPNTGVRDHVGARQMAAFANDARQRGSRFIGGCCGADAEILRAMGESLS
jgi:5-methyltetrahydrofolate--homocysteine methyltransferase